MAVKDGKCPNCGGNLEVDDEHQTLVCQYCYSIISTQEAINNYNINNHNNIRADVVNMVGNQSKDFKITGRVLQKYTREPTKVIIPENVTHIGQNAFKNCIGITEVVIPENVEYIGNYAFSGCESLKSINIPNSVKKIGEGAFSGCTSLKSIKIPDSVTGDINNTVFAGCTNLKSIRGGKNLRSIYIPESIYSIGNSAFKDCTKLESVYIPNTVKFIHESAFSGCTSLKSIKIPDSVLNIESEAFKNCINLTSVTIPSRFTSGSPANLSSHSNDFSIFDGCTNLKLIKKYDKKIMTDYKLFSDSPIIMERIKKHRCMYCGGKFEFSVPIINKLLVPVCKDCGNLKNYDVWIVYV